MHRPLRLSASGIRCGRNETSSRHPLELSRGFRNNERSQASIGRESGSLIVTIIREVSD